MGRTIIGHTDLITGDLPVETYLYNGNDRVNHPSHYTYGNIQVSDAIIDWNLNFLLGNVVKYVARAGKKEEEGMTKKEKEIQDLEKAAWYLNKQISVLKGKE